MSTNHDDMEDEIEELQEEGEQHWGDTAFGGLLGFGLMIFLALCGFAAIAYFSK